MGTVTTKAFTWAPTDEPHALRRKAILMKHPEIQDLFGVEPLTFPIVMGLVLAQIFLASQAPSMSWSLFLAVAYCVGGTISHSLQLATHELSHDLCFHDKWKNRALSIFANTATATPSAITFMRYHKLHHSFQGHDGMDTDIPSAWEVRAFSNTILKLLWLVLQPAFYALRPLIVHPKKPTLWEIANWAWVVTCDALIYHLLGQRALLYLVASSLLGLGLHPAAGHFIAEHYEFSPGVETYSYEGCLNRVNFNVGYHCQHHDLPRIPWSRLPTVRKLAPEFYDLPHHTSYLAVFWRYLTDPTMGPARRIKRQPKIATEVDRTSF